MSDPTTGYGFGTQTANTAQPEASEKKPAKTVSRREIEGALDALKPVEAVPPTPAEKERAKRLERANQLVVNFGEALKALGLLDTRDLAKAEAAVRALGNVAKNTAAAIEAIPDSRLVDEVPKAPRQPRAPKETTGAAVLAPDDALVTDSKLTEVDGEVTIPEDRPAGSTPDDGTGF